MTDITSGYRRNKSLLKPQNKITIKESGNESDHSISSDEESLVSLQESPARTLSQTAQGIKGLAESRRASKRAEPNSTNGKRINVEFLNQKMEINEEQTPSKTVAI